MTEARNIYILGNAGVGKTLLVNSLLGNWKYASKNQAMSCTRTVEFSPAVIGDKMYRVYNIPGLLEADPERVKTNVRLLSGTLDRKELSIILYVLTTEGGRVRDSDYAAYFALKQAYNLGQHSFCFVVNKALEMDNQPEIAEYIQEILGKQQVVFLKNYMLSDQKMQEEFPRISHEISATLVPTIQELQASELKKIRELRLAAEEIQELKQTARKLKEEYETRLERERAEHEIKMLHERKLHETQMRHQQEQAEAAQRAASLEIERERKQKESAEQAAAQARLETQASTQAAESARQAAAAAQAQAQAAQAQIAQIQAQGKKKRGFLSFSLGPVSINV